MPEAKTGTQPLALLGWQQRASQFFCLIMIFGFPIFSVPCPKGTCTSPLDVVTTYAYVKDVVSEEILKGCLYPASIIQNMEVLVSSDPQNFTFPKWDTMLSRWNLTQAIVEKDDGRVSDEISFTPSLVTMFDADGKALNWEFVGACVICLVAGLFSAIGPNRYSLWGTLLVLWFVVVDGGRRTDVHFQPMFVLTLICSLAWINFKKLWSWYGATTGESQFTGGSKKRD